MLTAFGPTEVLAAPPVRCVQTVTPLAEALGLPLGSVPELGEDGFGDDPQAGIDRVEAWLEERRGPGVTVVCSQGGAIPSVLMALGVRFPGTTGSLWPPSAKGSVWVLGGQPGRLLADYYRDFPADPDS